MACKGKIVKLAVLGIATALLAGCAHSEKPVAEKKKPAKQDFSQRAIG